MARPPPEPNWLTAQDIVVPKQMPIRAFENGRGNIVLVQEAESEHEEDPLIEIRPDNVPAVIAALARLIEAGPEEVK